MRKGLFVLCMFLLPLLAVPLSARGQTPSLSGEKWTGKLAQMPAPLPAGKASLGKVNTPSALNIGTRLTTSDQAYSRGQTRWSPNGSWIAYEQEGDIYIISPQGGAPKNLTASIDGYCYAPSFTPDGKAIVYTWYDGTDFNTNEIDQMDISTGTVTNLFTSGACGVWSHNGKLFAGRDLSGQLVVIDASTKIQTVINAGDGYYEYLCFSADDTAIITTIVDSQSTGKLYAFSPSGGSPAQITKHDGMHLYPDCSPDGKWILYTYMNTDGDTQLYALSTSDLSYQPVFPTSAGLYYCCGSFSPTSQRFSYLNWDTTLQCYEVYVAPFPLTTVSSSITVTSPNGGETWTAGTSQNITWTSTTDIAAVNIHYSTDNGTNWKPIVIAATAMYGLFAWTIPDSLSGKFLIRVSSSSDASIGDISDAVFTIQKTTKLTLTSPNGGEVISAGASFPITWTSSGITQVYLEYSTDGGSSWNMIAGGVNASTGSYSWTTPSVASANYLVRISDSEDMTVKDISDAKFTIAVPTVKVTSPNGGEVWTAGSTQNITWNSAGVDNVVLSYSTDGGTTWTTIETKLAAIPRTYSWKTPSVNSQKCLVRVSDSASLSRNDVSDAVFTIAPATSASITVTSPNGNERWISGSSHPVTWTSSGVSYVNIDFSSDGGSTWSSVATNVNSGSGTGSYPFTIPDLISRNCIFRISSNSDSSIKDVSDAAFTIAPIPFLKVLNPAGGETWASGETRAIIFRGSGVSRVDLEYSTDNGANWQTIVSGVDVTTLNVISTNLNIVSDYSFSWTLPSIASASSNCMVRVINANDTLIRDRSTAFTITAEPSIALTYPAGGETFQVGETVTIRWNAAGVTNVNIGFTTDPTGQTYDYLIGTNIDASLGQYQWTVPNSITVTGTIIVVKTGSDTPYDYNRTFFNIEAAQSSITLLSPNGGETYQPGKKVTVRWQSQNMGQIAIMYTTDNWFTSDYISQTIDSSAGSVEWTIPNVNSSTCMVGLGDGVTNDYSDAFFTIAPGAQPYVQLTAPNGGEVWTAGTAQNIRWTSQNSSSVKLDYSTDSGTNWKMITASTSATTEVYSWNVPNEISANCLVRITDVTDVSAQDVSDGQFSIISSATAFITVKAPVEGDQWAIGSTQVIKWDFRGISGVKIELSTDNGTSWTAVAVNPSTAANGTYSWTVPDSISTKCIIRISDTGDATVFGVSGKFEILKPKLVITHTPITEAAETSVLTFTASVVGAANPIVELVYGITGERTFETRVIMKKSGDNTYSCTLAQGTFTANGIEYIISARDSVNVGLRASIPETGYYCITARVTDMVSTNTIAGGSIQNAYRMFSVPLDLDADAVADQFTRQPKGSMGPDWRLFRFSPGETDPKEYPNIDGFNPGTAFWLITRNEFKFQAPAGKTVTTADPFTMTLKPGWNDIANPWMFDISWNDIENPSNASLSVPYAYEGSWSDPTSSSRVLKPWRGYAVKNLENRNVIIRLTPKPAAGTQKIAVFRDDMQWKLTLSATAGLASDRANHIGVRSDALSEWDSTDHVEPPVIGEYVSLSFPHQDWANHPSAYTVDFRSPGSSLAWNFDVKTNISDQRVTVSLEGLSSLPEGAAVKITDRDTGNVVETAGNSFSFLSSTSGIERHFTLTVSNANDTENTDSQTRPAQYVTTRSYPNPFNPSTVIRYELSQSGRVLITVFNTVGQKVREYDLGMRDRGAHELVFNAKGLTSGTYMYRVDAGYATVQGKMMFMK